jgi:hypothetical protein
MSLCLFAPGCCSIAFLTKIPLSSLYVSIAQLSSNEYVDGIFSFVPDDFMVLVLYSKLQLCFSMN